MVITANNIAKLHSIAVDIAAAYNLLPPADRTQAAVTNIVNLLDELRAETVAMAEDEVRNSATAAKRDNIHALFEAADVLDVHAATLRTTSYVESIDFTSLYSLYSEAAKA